MSIFLNSTKPTSNGWCGTCYHDEHSNTNKEKIKPGQEGNDGVG